MRTIVLTNKYEAQKIFHKFIHNSDSINVESVCRNLDNIKIRFENGDTIKFLTPSENIRGVSCDVLYVPATMTVEKIHWWSMVLSRGWDIEVIVYRVIENRKIKRSV